MFGFRVLCLVLFSVPALHAQELAVIDKEHLKFGDEIFPGIARTITHADSDAAGFEIRGEAGTEVHLSFRLPDALVSGGNGLTVEFGPDSAGYSTLEDGQSSAVTFSPADGAVTVLGPDGRLFVWLGGTIWPPHYQQGGSYSAEIVLEAAYTTE